jgi:gluconate 5-dehydrogenase
MYKKLFNLNGKTIVVTGGLGYLGIEIAKGLRDFGANVIIIDIKETNTSDFHYYKCNLNDSKEITFTFNKILDRFKSIDSLFALAAYTGYAGSGETHQLSDEEWNKGIEGTLGITFKTLKAVLPIMIKNGGNIVTFGSLYSWIAPDFRIYDSNNISPPNYGSGKAGVVQLTRHVASQYAKYNIRANVITPGSYPHPKSFENKAFIDKLANRNMVGRIGFPSDLVGTCIFLVSNASKFITGTNISVDGGQLSW